MSPYITVLSTQDSHDQKEHMEHYKILKFGVYQACTTDGPTVHCKLLVKLLCERAPKSLFWVPACVPGFEYAP